MFRSTIHPALFCVSFLALSGACSVVEPDDTEFRTTYSGVSWGCGNCGAGNSATINSFRINELNLDGANDAGVTVIRLEDPYGRPYAVDIGSQDDLVARYTVGGNKAADGLALVNWTLVLAGPKGEPLRILISDIQEVDTWDTNDEVILTYKFVYQEVPGEGDWKDVCTANYNIDPDTNITLIARERYDEATKTVAEAPDWFTLACRGEAAAKMKLLGYGPNGNFEQDTPATIDQRQATIKMLTADYCGTGHSFTEHGTPLIWNNGSTVDVPIDEGDELEAYWGPEGALCLDHPRHAERKEVTEMCNLPLCSTVNPNLADWTTHTPRPE